MGKIVTWSTPIYAESNTAQESDRLFYAENVFRYMKFRSPLSVKFCLGETLSYIVDNQKLLVPASSYMIVNDGLEMECLPCRPGIKAIALFFTNDLISDVNRASRCTENKLLDDPYIHTGSLDFFQHIYRHPSPLSSQLLTIARRMSDSGASDDNLDPGVFFGLARTLLSFQHDVSRQMGRVNARTPTTREELFRRVLRAREYMLDNWNSELTLAQIARQACISPYHFHRTFREVFGHSPMKWFRQYKLERAEELLQGGRISVTEAALRCGFSDVFTFSKAFKRARGYSPSGLITAGGIQ